MLNLVKAELYKYSRKSFAYKLLAVLIGLIILMPIAINSFNPPGITREVLISNFGFAFNFILILVMVFAVVFLDDYREGTYKNLIVSNLSRTEIYLGKFIAQIILAFIIMFICLIAVTIALMFIQSDGNSLVLLSNVITRFLCSIPIYIAGISIANLLAITIKRGLIYIVYYLVITNMKGLVWILSIFIWKKFNCINNILLTTLLSNVGSINTSKLTLVFSILGGTIYTIIFVLIGIIIFNKQEIK